MLRVAYDVTVSGRTPTGVGIYARELFQALRARPLDLRRLQHTLLPDTRPLHRLANGARLARWFSLGVHRELEEQDVAVYHSTTSVGPIRRRRPIVITIHDATHKIMPVHSGLADRAFQRVFRQQAARSADAILTSSHAAAQAIEDAYGIPAARIRVSPLGVADIFRSVTPGDVDRVRARYDLGFPYVLYVGAQPPRKNLRRLIEAFARLAPVYPDVHLLLGGPASRRDRALASIVETHPAHRRIHQLEVASRDDLPGLYAGAACVAYVSLCEGFGLPIVEAMASGAPVVTSDRSSMLEVARGAAICVDPLSVDAIADGIGRILADSELVSRMRERGRVESRAYDWAITAAVTEAVYRDVAGR